MKTPYLDILDEIDFSLKRIPASEIYLPQKVSDKFNVYFGNIGWNEKAFISKIYPAKTKQKDFLANYSKVFNSVLLNSTKFGLPNPDEIQKWYSQTPENFKFSFKIPHYISHQRKIDDDEVLEDLIEFIDKVSILNDKLGMLQLGFSAGFKPERAPELYNLIKHLPEGVQLAVGLRNAKFFENTEIIKEVTNKLASHSTSYSFKDTPERRDLLHMHISSKSLFVEFLGNKLHTSDFARVDNWILKIKELKEMGLENVYFYVTQPAPVKSACYDLLKYFIEGLNKISNPQQFSIGDLP